MKKLNTDPDIEIQDLLKSLICHFQMYEFMAFKALYPLL